jgi:RsiW-degrading membrane proteinase PrsW (M82 family)
VNWTVITYALLVGLLPSFIWLFFWTREDVTHPEPRKVLAGCFLGGVIAVFAAFHIEKLVGLYIRDWNMTISYFSLGITELQYIAWVIIEEILKLIVLIIALMTKADDEPIDAMIYAITIALGFSAMENMLFITHPFEIGQIGEGIITGTTRFIGATIVHTVSTASIGFMVGLTFFKTRLKKILFGIIGFIIALSLHSAFNLSIIKSTGSDVLKIFTWFWLAVVILIILFEEIKVVKPKLSKK